VLASWRLLTPAEQVCLCWLGVFEWRWSIDLAEELLAAGPGRDIPDVVALVDRLAGLGLISVRPGAAENMRFWLLEAVRSVALQEAAANGSLGPARDRHAVVMARLAARTPAEVTGAAVATRLENLLSDLQAALDHLERRGSVPAQRDNSFGGDESDDGFVEVARLRAEVRGWMERRGLTAPR
jgi:hypothetical protein